jgi:hypothetical protein
LSSKRVFSSSNKGLLLDTLQLHNPSFRFLPHTWQKPLQSSEQTARIGKLKSILLTTPVQVQFYYPKTAKYPFAHPH